MLQELANKSNAGPDSLQGWRNGKPIPKPKIYKLYDDPGVIAPQDRPDYKAITMRNEVRMDMLESLGGLESSIKPLEKDLRKHEMRPYDYVRNYGEEIRQMRENPSFVCEGGET
jgi:hypothetical protein